jgi:hypothetical protein
MGLRTLCSVAMGVLVCVRGYVQCRRRYACSAPGDAPIVPVTFCEVLNGLEIQGGTLIVGRPFPTRLKELRRPPLFEVSPHFPVHVR